MNIIIIGLLIPFMGTTLGAAMVFFMKQEINPGLQKLLLGFTSGVMIAASIWSLLIPSLEMTTNTNTIKWLPASLGFLGGMAFLLLLDSLIPHLHINSEKPEGVKTKIKKSGMLVLAITLHNIPEGMAVGVVFAGAMAMDSGISTAAAMALSLGIALQNFPEGAIVSMPLKAAGGSKWKSFGLGTLSGLVEPIAAVTTILLMEIMLPILPYLLAFAAGAMIYVVVEELIPQSQEGSHSNIATIGVAIGFVLMMILDIALG